MSKFPATALILVTLFASSCSLMTSHKEVTIQDVGWYIENAAQDYWPSEWADKPSLVYNFRIYFKEDLDVSDIAYARIYLPDGSGSYWQIDKSRYFDGATRSIGGATSCSYSKNSDELPIGTLTAVITLQNGESDSYAFEMGIPGSTQAGMYSFAYSAQDEASPSDPSASAPAVMRPDVDDLSFVGDNLATTFTVRGDHVRNGWVWYYDAGDNYVGRSTYFYDQKTDLSATNFQAGRFDKSRDARNILMLSADDIVRNDGSRITTAELDLIRHCRVFVTDGDQYDGGAIQYDYRAMSMYF